MKRFDLSLKFNGFDIARAKKELDAILAVPEEEYRDFIEQKKREILSFHLANNSFYQSLAPKADPKDWNSVPVLTKRQLQKPLVERLSKGYTLKNCYVNKTSGSSGDPFVFAKDKVCHALTWAEIIYKFGWFGIDFNTSKQARFYGIPLDKKGYYKERFKDFLSRRYRFSVFDLSDKTLEKNLKKFITTPFDYINGYTSSVVQFAKHLKAKNIVLKTLCPSLRVCIVTSEMLFPDDKLLMEQYFGVPVVNEYGASELSLIAFQNSQGEWVANSETLFIEILDEKNQPVPNGTEGRVVITALYNKAHPFIRYDIGDVGILSKASTPKRPIFEKLIGRTNDLAVLPSGKKAAGLTFYYITKSIVEDDGNVKEFIIEQHTSEKFIVRYVSAKILSEHKMNIIRKEMEHYLEPGLTINFERQAQLKRSKSGKLKQFVSHLNITP